MPYPYAPVCQLLWLLLNPGTQSTRDVITTLCWDPEYLESRVDGCLGLGRLEIIRVEADAAFSAETQFFLGLHVQTCPCSLAAWGQNLQQTVRSFYRVYD